MLKQQIAMLSASFYLKGNSSVIFYVVSKRYFDLSKRSFRRYSCCGIAGFHFSYSVAKCIIDGLLFGSTEYIFTPENPKQMHLTVAKHLSVGEV